MTIHDIQSLVARRYGVTVLDLRSARQDRRTARSRQVAMWLCRNTVPRHTLKAIGEAFGDRDHTTVLQAVRRAGARIEEVRP